MKVSRDHVQLRLAQSGASQGTVVLCNKNERRLGPL